MESFEKEIIEKARQINQMVMNYNNSVSLSNGKEISDEILFKKIDLQYLILFKIRKFSKNTEFICHIKRMVENNLGGYQLINIKMILDLIKAIMTEHNVKQNDNINICDDKKSPEIFMQMKRYIHNSNDDKINSDGCIYEWKIEYEQSGK